MKKCKTSLLQYASQLAKQLNSNRRERAAETYMAAVKSFIKFIGATDINLGSIDKATVTSYNYFLKRNGLSANTISFYNRNLRAIYNHAIDDDLICNAAPFRRVFTGTNRTAKRAIDAASISRIAHLDISGSPSLQFAADLFLFSFYTQGMAFVDIAKLKYSNIHNGYLVYNRSKTGQQIAIRLEACMWYIIKKYHNYSNPHIFPIIRGIDPRREYLNASHNINRNLKRIGEILEFDKPLTFYVARHSWASIAHMQQIPVPTISRALGHNSESTTRIYLATLDNSAVDNANKKVIEALSF